jgi:hypothetical protein
MSVQRVLQKITTVLDHARVAYMLTRSAGGSMKRNLAIVFVCLTTLTVFAQTLNAPEPAIDVEDTKWIDNVLRSVQTIKVGMTRAELLEVFTTEGGLSFISQRTYVYRQCPHVKVDVKFAVTNREKELPTDKIVEISRPYLQWSIMD